MASPLEPSCATDEVARCGRLAHGEEIAAHFHDYGQLRYAASGALVTTTDGGTWVAPATRIMWVPPLHVHRSRSYGTTDVRVFRVPAEVADRLPATPSVFVASALLRAAYVAMLDENEPVESPRGRLLIEVVIGELERAAQESLRVPEPSDARLKAVTDRLHADPASTATLTELGRQGGASERTLSRLFRTELAMSFHQWRTLLRVQHAVIDLAEGASVTDTALRLGWSNPSSFIEAFTEIIGQTPGRYRAAP